MKKINRDTPQSHLYLAKKIGREITKGKREREGLESVNSEEKARDRECEIEREGEI